MSDVLNIEEFLRDEGFDTPEALRRARALLEAHHLTRPGKQGMAASKLPTARALLASALLRVCSEACLHLGLAGPGEPREAVLVANPSCEVCGGSNNRRAAQRLARQLKAGRIYRLLIVGGTPTQHAQLDQLLAPEGIHLRYVDGATGSHSKRDALPNLQWAHLMVIWGATPLPHKVSHLYTDAPPEHLRIVKVPRRGIEALCEEIVRSLG
ncbi:MAG: hypothetical protein HY689_07465 [Chloroflexi bacterium]|nr:hypothetical protein [Chloroflexota bacterium]